LSILFSTSKFQSVSGNVDEQKELRYQERFHRRDSQVFEPFSNPNPDREVVRRAVDEYRERSVCRYHRAQKAALLRLYHRTVRACRRRLDLETIALQVLFYFPLQDTQISAFPLVVPNPFSNHDILRIRSSRVY
jgi:hypothetical protein